MPQAAHQPTDAQAAALRALLSTGRVHRFILPDFHSLEHATKFCEVVETNCINAKVVAVTEEGTLLVMLNSADVDTARLERLMNKWHWETMR